jgi:hypothetical protein
MVNRKWTKIQTIGAKIRGKLTSEQRKAHWKLGLNSGGPERSCSTSGWSYVTSRHVLCNILSAIVCVFVLFLLVISLSVSFELGFLIIPIRGKLTSEQRKAHWKLGLNSGGPERSCSTSGWSYVTSRHHLIWILCSIPVYVNSFYCLSFDLKFPIIPIYVQSVLLFCVTFCRPLFVCLSFSFWSFHCLFPSN